MAAVKQQDRGWASRQHQTGQTFALSRKGIRPRHANGWIPRDRLSAQWRRLGPTCCQYQELTPWTFRLEPELTPWNRSDMLPIPRTDPLDRSDRLFLLACDAIKLRSRADEQAPLRDGDARAQIAVALVTHRGRVQDLELLARLHHVNVATLAHEINFAVGAGGRRFDLRRAARLAHPFDLATLRNDTGNRFPITVEDIKPVLIK